MTEAVEFANTSDLPFEVRSGNGRSALKSLRGRFGGALVVLAPIGPLLPAVITTCWVARPADWGLGTGQNVLVALGFGIVAWGLLALLSSGRATVRTANSRVYHDLANAVSWLDSTLERLEQEHEHKHKSVCGGNCVKELNRLRLEIYEVRAVLHVYPVFRAQVERIERHVQRRLIRLRSFLTKETVDETRLYYLAPAGFLPDPRDVMAEASAFDGEVHWLLGTAYNELYHRLHLIEADLLLLCPVEELKAYALEDYFRLAGSQISGRELWQYQIERAVSMLGEDPYTFFHRPGPSAASRGTRRPDSVLIRPSTRSRMARFASRVRRVCPSGRAQGNLASVADPTEGNSVTARFLLREVRTAVDEFRDSSFEGLVRLRGRTMWTLFAASCTVYIALALAALLGADSQLVVGAGALFLIGVAVGLLNRLLTEQELGSDVEDYGLSTVRLFQTIVISGIAAVVGVVMATYGAYLIDQSDILSIQGDTTGAENAPQISVPKLRDVFDVDSSPALLLVAAAFALAPGKLLNRLEASANNLKQEIKSIEPGSRVGG